jgi:hypothetical protein
LSIQLLLKIIASLMRLKEYWQRQSNHNDDDNVRPNFIGRV